MYKKIFSSTNKIYVLCVNYLIKDYQDSKLNHSFSYISYYHRYYQDIFFQEIPQWQI